jgi:hypothetical protein
MGPTGGATNALPLNTGQIAGLVASTKLKIHDKIKELGNLTKQLKSAQCAITDDNVNEAVKKALVLAKEVQKLGMDNGELLANTGSVMDAFVQRKTKELARDTNEVKQSPNTAVKNQQLDDEIKAVLKVVLQAQHFGLDGRTILIQAAYSLKLLLDRKISRINGILEARERLDLAGEATRSLGLGERKTQNSAFSDDKIKEAFKDLMRLAGHLQSMGVSISSSFYDVVAKVEKRLKK